MNKIQLSSVYGSWPVKDRHWFGTRGLMLDCAIQSFSLFVNPLWDQQKGDITYDLPDMVLQPSSVIIPMQQPDKFELADLYGWVSSRVRTFAPELCISAERWMNVTMRGDCKS